MTLARGQESSTVVVVGGYGGIGSAVVRHLAKSNADVIAVGRGQGVGTRQVRAVVCAAGSFTEPLRDCLESVTDALTYYHADIFVALSGGGVGGPPDSRACSLPPLYYASKAAVVGLMEWYAAKYPDKQFFAVAPGRVATKLTNYDGCSPDIPAAFICKILTGKYAHLSGSLLAALRDDLDTMKPMKLRRVDT